MSTPAPAVERMVWMDTIEPGTILQWTYYKGGKPAPEWLTVLATRADGDTVWAIAVREDGEQAAVSLKGCLPVRIRVADAGE